MGRAKHNYERLKKLKAKKAAEAKFQRKREQRIEQRRTDKITGKAQDKRRKARQKKIKELEQAGKVQIGKPIPPPISVRILQERKWRIDHDEPQSNVDASRRDGKPSFGYRPRGQERHDVVLDKMSKYNVASCKEGAVLPPYLVERCAQRKDRLLKIDNGLAGASIPMSAARAHIAQKLSKSMFAKRKRKQYARDVIAPLLELPKGSHSRLIRRGLLKALRTGKELVIAKVGEDSFQSLVEILSAKPERQHEKLVLRALDVVLRICCSPDVHEDQLSGPLRMWRRAFFEHFRPPSRNRNKTLKLLEPWRLPVLLSQSLTQEPISLVLGAVFMPQLPPLLAAARACRRRVVLHAPPSALSCASRANSGATSSKKKLEHYGDKLWQNWGAAPKPVVKKVKASNAKNSDKQSNKDEELISSMSKASLNPEYSEDWFDNEAGPSQNNADAGEINLPTKPSGKKMVFNDSDDEAASGNVSESGNASNDGDGFLIGLNGSSDEGEMEPWQPPNEGGEDVDADWRDHEWDQNENWDENTNEEKIPEPSESDEPFFVEPTTSKGVSFLSGESGLTSKRDLVSSSEENDFAKFEVGATLDANEEERSHSDSDQEMEDTGSNSSEPFFSNGLEADDDSNVDADQDTFDGGLADYEDEGCHSNDEISDEEYARELAELDEFMANEMAEEGSGPVPAASSKKKNKKKRSSSFDRPTKKFKKSRGVH